MEGNKDLILFEGKTIRKIWHNEEWLFSIVDVIEVLTSSPSPKTYWEKLKKREFFEPSPIWGRFKLLAKDGKQRLTDCANTEGIFRIVMSVSSPKAEPLKMWMAQVSKERIDETEDPELMTERQMEIYKAKGYTDEWIKERIQSIHTRKRLTDEWKNREVREGQEYSILTAIIAKGTFGLTPKEHKEFKGLTKPSQNLRDHMTPLELVFTSLGEVLTRDEAIKADAKGFDKNRIAAVKGGDMAGQARELIEQRRGENVVSDSNFLNPPSDKTDALPASDTPTLF